MSTVYSIHYIHFFVSLISSITVSGLFQNIIITFVAPEMRVVQYCRHDTSGQSKN